MAKNFVKIDTYTEGGNEFNALKLEATHYNYRKAMYLQVTPVEQNEFGYSQVYDFGSNPLTAGLTLAILPMPRKNQKRIDAAQSDLNGMASRIADLWNKRDFDTLKTLFA